MTAKAMPPRVRQRSAATSGAVMNWCQWLCHGSLQRRSIHGRRLMQRPALDWLRAMHRVSIPKPMKTGTAATRAVMSVDQVIAASKRFHPLAKMSPTGHIQPGHRPLQVRRISTTSPQNSLAMLVKRL